MAFKRKQILPLVSVFPGALWLLYLVGRNHPQTHFNGDAGLKAYILENWFEGGRISMRATWPGTPDWASRIWEDFHTPIYSLFVLEDQFIFSPLFMCFTSPFFGLFNYCGLFILPVFSAIGIWAENTGSISTPIVRVMRTN